MVGGLTPFARPEKRRRWPADPRCFGGEDDLDAVAGGKNHGLADAFARLSAPSAPASDSSRKARRSRTSTGAVLWLTPSAAASWLQQDARRACAAQVSAENPSTVTVMMAACARHPAVTAGTPGPCTCPGEKRNGDGRLLDPGLLVLDEGQVLAAITASVISAKPSVMDFKSNRPAFPKAAAGRIACAASWISVGVPEIDRAGRHRGEQSAA